VERRAVHYLTLSLSGWLAYNPRRGVGGVGPGWETVLQLYWWPPYPRGGGVAVGGTGNRVEGGGPTTTRVSSELTRVSSELKNIIIQILPIICVKVHLNRKK
jgi:hypothetical protein